MRPTPIHCITDLAPYQPGKPIGELARELSMDVSNIVKLASNENPLGCSKDAVEAMKFEWSDIARYPDGGGYRLKEALSNYLGVPPDYITLGNGSNDVLEMVATVYLNHECSSIYSEHCFIVNKLATKSRGARGIEVSAMNFGHDLEKMLSSIESDTRVVFISNPNNPTGTFLAPPDVLAFLERVSGNVIVVLDEAYYEYLPPDLQSESMNWVKRFPNLIVTRTFSKIFGLAALRVGYGVASPEITELLNRVRQPFNVNSLAMSAAEASLKDKNFVSRSINVNRQGIVQLSRAFESRGLAFIRPHGNFITVEMPYDAGSIFQSLLSRGVIVRPISGYGLPNHLRVSVGLEQENNRFIEALDDSLSD